MIAVLGRTVKVCTAVLVFACTAYGYIDAQTAESPTSVDLITPRTVEVRQGEAFTVEFLVPRTPSSRIELSLPALPDGVRPNGSPVIVTRGLGQSEIRIPFMPEAPGRFVLEPIEVGTSAGAHRTPTILVEVRDPNTGSVPFDAEWQVLSGPVYRGMSVPVVLRLRGIDAFVYPESLSIRAPQSGLFEEVGGIGSVTSRRVNDRELYTIPVASFILTATSAGTLTIPPAEVAADGIRVRAPGLPVSIRALPGPASNAHAVGRFELSAEMDRDRLEPGETGELLIRVSGIGNLPVLELPSVRLEGLVEVDRSERSSFEPDTSDLNGYRGWRELRVRFEGAGGSESGVVEISSFRVFDPVTEETTTAPARRFAVRLVPAPTGESSRRPLPELTLIPVAELARRAWVPLREVPLFFAVFAIGPALFAGSRLLFVRTSSVALLSLLSMLALSAGLFPAVSTERLARAHEIDQEGRPAVAGVLYALELQRHGWHAGLHYNRGVLAVRARDPVDAIYHLRRAVRLAPARDDFRSALRDAEAFFELENQPRIPSPMGPDPAMIGLAVTWTLGWGFGGARRSAFRTGAVVSLAVATILFAGAWAWAASRASVSEGVVSSEVTVRRIPDRRAQAWVRLTPASVVRVELSYSEFYLVRTPSGVGGWVPQNALLIQGDQ